VREDSLVDDIGRAHLMQFLENNTLVKMAYDYRTQLHAIWNRTTASQQELLDAFHDWCLRAEATGIQTLQQFVGYLKGYTIRSC
jgi:stearoyl-CoA desaturase (delta-9 desaturase)